MILIPNEDHLTWQPDNELPGVFNATWKREGFDDVTFMLAPFETEGMKRYWLNVGEPQFDQSRSFMYGSMDEARVAAENYILMIQGIAREL